MTLHEKVAEKLEQEENRIKHAYKDHLGYWTIGVGFLIDERKNGGLRDEEIDFILFNRISIIERELLRRMPWIAKLNEPRRGALILMAFQMGVDGLMGFTNSLAILKMGDYERAAHNFSLSLWARQTPARAKRVCKQIRTGEWQ